MTVSADEIKDFAKSIGFDAVGFVVAEPMEAAERALENWVERGHHGQMKYLADYRKRFARLKSEIPDAKTLIVFGVNYFTHHSRRNDDGGRVARYAWGKDYHHVIKERLKKIEVFILERAGNGAKCLACVDTQPILERSVAERAGLGFRGKHTNLLSRDFGPWLFLAELLTNVEFPPDRPEFHGTCGSCTACLEICPTGAITEPNLVDATRCISYLTIEHKGVIARELRPHLKNWVFGCDECLNICPFTRQSKESRWEEFREESGAGSRLDLLSLFQLRSNRDYERKFQGTPLLRASRKMMLRNASVSLGNLKESGRFPC
jgi:epoxyqueuosine reductase